MVTTRGQIAASVEGTPAKAGKAATDKEQTPIAKLPVRAKANLGRTKVVVEIPVRRLSEIPSSQDCDSEIEDVKATEDVGSDIPAVEAEGGVRIQDTKSSQQTAAEINDSEEDSEAEEIGKKQATPSKQPTKSPAKNIEKSPEPVSASQIPEKPKHKRFGSEEPEPELEIFATAPEIVESEDESSDDDMVEEITLKDASRAAAAKEREAAKAIEEQESVLRQKRKYRETALNRQTDAANKKRKRESEIEERRAKKSQPVEPIVDDSPPSPKKNRLNDEASPEVPTNILPDFPEYESTASATLSLSTEQKLVQFGSKYTTEKPKDRRKGATTYRVVEAASSLFPPKADLNSRTVKDTWRQNRPGKGESKNRQGWKGGFLKSARPRTENHTTTGKRGWKVEKREKKMLE